MSADEIDAELLALAGDSSDDEADAPGSEVDDIADRSPSQEAKPSVEKKDDVGGRAKGVAQRVRKRGGRKKRRGSSEEDDDFGEISEPESERSPPMAGQMSDSDHDVPTSSLDDEDAPLYPVEGKFVSEQERDDILSRPEIEREQILAEREEAVQKRLQDLQLKQLLSRARKDGEKAKKRTATAAELGDEDGARSRRPKAEGKGRSALDAYKQAREAKGADRTSRVEAPGRRSRRDERSPSSAGSDRDADAESEVEWAEPSSDRRDRDEPAPALRDFELCRVGRSNFAKVCFWPGFEDTIKGCFARVFLEQSRTTGQNVYRMAQIKGFTEGRPYTLEGSQGRTFTTDQYVLLAQGPNTKPFPFSVCSDSRFTDQEHDIFKSVLDKSSQRPPARKFLSQKNDDIHRFLNRAWSDADITERLRRTNEMRMKHDPANQLAIKKERILKDRARAQEEGDEEGVSRFDAELAALENSRAGGAANASANVKQSPVKNAAVQAQDRLAKLNQLNKKRTSEEVRKALIEEKKKLQRARERAMEEHKRKQEEDKARAEAEKARKLLGPDDHDLFGSDISRGATPVPGGTPRRSRAATPLNGMKREASSNLGLKAVAGSMRKKGNVDDEVLADMDLGIDIEI